METGGHLTGKLQSQFFLGDVNDCRILVGEDTLLRVSAEPETLGVLTDGQDVGLDLKGFLVYEDDGRDDHSKILT